MADDLAGLVAQVRLVAEAAVLRRINAGAGVADPRDLAQLYLRDEAAQARLIAGTLRPQGSHRRAMAEVEHALVRAGAEAAEGTRLAVLAARLDLDELAAQLVAVCAGYALDLDVRELCHALAGRRRPALYADVCADVLRAPPRALLPALAPGAPARRGRAVVVDGAGLGAALELAPAALAWLLGDDRLPALGGAARLLATDAAPLVELPERVRRAADALVPRLAGGRAVAVLLRGPRGSGRRAVAHRLAAALGRPLVVVDGPALRRAEAAAGAPLLGQALAAARLRGAVPYLAEVDALHDEHGELAAAHLDALEGAPGALLAGSTGRGGHLDLGRPTLTLAVPRAELADRERAWAAALAATAAPADLGPELAGRYVLGPGAIADVAAEAARHAEAAGGAVDRDALEAALGRRLSLRLGAFGAVVARKARLEELVAPAEVLDALGDMIAMVQGRAQILERWGYQRHLGISRGVAALFSGDPGTGKTMAASVVASALGLELVRIDLSAVVSKYVGETEKNLARIFDEAQDAHAMLLFDEADSLFGKRTEVKTAQDRFANLEVNYILQRMETFDGVSVLTTNAESAIDPALQRRLNFRVRFPAPEPDERERLWRQLLPPATGLHGRADLRALAARFAMTGGYIKNAVVRAAVIAARAGRGLTPDDLWAAAHLEYVEMGKVLPDLPAHRPPEDRR